MAVCAHCATPLPDHSNFCSICGTPTSAGQVAEDPTLSPQGREIFDRLRAATEGRYEIERELGRGGMAVVFLGYQRSLDRPIAIKVLLPVLGYDRQVVERFQREARTQGNLEHPGIISVYEVYNEAGLTFFTMPFVKGPSLRAYLIENPQPRIRTVQRYMRQAAEALAYAHRRGVIHRDIKPDNILLDQERDSVILTDFGIAKALQAETTLTTPGDLLGTPHYMSPEQGEGRGDLDGRADQYSLGLIGYEMLAGRRPFEAETLAELMYKHRFEEPPSLEVLRPEAPGALREAIERAMRKEREERFPTMDAFLAALEGPSWLEPGPDEAVAVTPTRGGAEATTIRVTTPAGASGVTAAESAEEARREGRGSRFRMALGAGAALAVVVAALVLLGPLRDPIGLGTDAGDPGGMVRAPRPQAGEGGTSAGTMGEEQSPGAADEDAAGPRDRSDPSGEGADDRGAATGPTRARVDEARQRARRSRSTALEAGAADVAASGLESLDARLASAESELQAGRLEVALGAFSALEDEYRRLAATASDSLESVTFAVQAEAERAREAAVSGGVGRLFPEELGGVDGTWEEGRRALAEGRMAEARGLFERAARGYSDLSARAVEVVRGRAEDARAAMREARQEAVEQGSERQAPKRMAVADGLRTRGMEAWRAERFADATSLFDQAREAYDGIAATIARGGVGGRRSGRGEATAGQQLRALVGDFRRAFEQEDMTYLQEQVYGGRMPEDDASYYRAIFERADELQADGRIASLEVQENSARARLVMRLSFRQARTRTPGAVTERLDMHFVRDADGWRLERIRR